MLLVHEDIEINDGDCAASNEDADFTGTIQVEAVFGDAVAVPEEEVGEEEAHGRLIETVDHVRPGQSEERLRTRYQNFHCVHSLRRMPRMYSCGTFIATSAVTS